ncbi:MAG: HD domain-containing protein [Candidatus Omnitrophica bacterium]|nr:HD domain-containing protein [Candidatus Omnitrophota bacterium]
MKKTLKITSIRLIQLVLLLVTGFIYTADVCSAQEAIEALSPWLHINDKLVKDGFFLSKLFLPIVDMVYKIRLNKDNYNELPIVISYWKNGGGGISVNFEVHFKHDKPGILHAIFAALSQKDTGGNLVTHEVNVNWFELLNTEREWILKLSCEVKDFYRLKRIVRELDMNMRGISPKSPFENGYRVNYVVEFELERPETLPQVTEFFADEEQNINILSFLTPKFVAEGQDLSKFIFEIEIPEDNPAKMFRNVKMPLSKREKEEYYLNFIRDSLSIITGCRLSCVKITKGTIVDRTLQKMIEDITWRGEKEELMGILSVNKNTIRQALEVIARKNLGRARKNKTAPYISHQIDIAKNIDAVFNLFTPEILNYLSGYMQHPAVTILTAIILHDAVEDRDISEGDLREQFGEDVYGIVMLLTKNRGDKEIKYYEKLSSRKDIVALVSQLVKIADKHHNLSTLKGVNDATKLRTFFSCLEAFIPEFIDKIDLTKIEDSGLRLVFNRAIKVIKKKIVESGKELELLDENGRIDGGQFKIYAERENIKSGITIYQNVINRMRDDVETASGSNRDDKKILKPLEKLLEKEVLLEQAI